MKANAGCRARLEADAVSRHLDALVRRGCTDTCGPLSALRKPAGISCTTFGPSIKPVAIHINGPLVNAFVSERCVLHTELHVVRLHLSLNAFTRRMVRLPYYLSSQSRSILG